MSRETPRTNADTAALRREYAREGLSESAAHGDPLIQFDRWFSQALGASVLEPNAMTLATIDAEGMPSARIVLLKGFDARGFVFFTNYDSHKGKELAKTPRAALVFFWPELERQVRIVGAVERVSRDESEIYFHSRPPGSQLGAWASEQSAVIASRQVLEDRLVALEEQYRGREVPVPPHWGGFRVVPKTIELWQGRPNRLHDRLLYTRDGESWRRERLAP
ncbi:MAG: pyridoxamine 5-phosphate oxidase [Myxococcaceae bacterium]|nr:pyridoxamine 5-phosphate oxidase [Myxococcaceae bacterium]